MICARCQRPLRSGLCRKHRLRTVRDVVRARALAAARQRRYCAKKPRATCARCPALLDWKNACGLCVRCLRDSKRVTPEHRRERERRASRNAQRRRRAGWTRTRNPRQTPEVAQLIRAIDAGLLEE